MMMKRWLVLVGLMMLPAVAGRSLLMEPRPAHLGFAEKVQAHVHTVQQQTEKEGIGTVLSDAALLDQNSSMSSVTGFLNEIGPYLIRDTSVVDKAACSASLIKLLVPIVAQFQNAMFRGIHRIERALEYWQYQELHPVSYYFHKSPIKYFTFDQKKEVVQKIQALKRLREHHFECLGKINIQLSSFDEHAVARDQYPWIQKLGRVLFAYDESVSVAEDAELFPLLYEATHLVPHYKAYLREQLEKSDIPSFISRLWMEISGAAAAMGYGGRYLYTHQKEVKEHKDKTKKQLREVKNFVFGTCDSEAIDAEYKKYYDTLTALDNTHASKPVRSDLEAIQGMMRDERIHHSEIARKMIFFYLDVGVDGCRQIAKELKGAFDFTKSEPGRAESFVNYLLGSTHIRKHLGKAAEGLDTSEIDDGIPGEKKVPFPVGEAFQEAYNSAKLWANLETVENPRIWRLIRSAPFTIPAALVGHSLLRFYLRNRKKPTSEPLRIALVDIALLLNVYGDAAPTEMEPTDFGRLAYLAHKLELDIHLVPKQYRESFLIEVGLLHTSSLNAQQKMKVIDLMYKKYPFIACQGGTATTA